MPSVGASQADILSTHDITTFFYFESANALQILFYVIHYSSDSVNQWVQSKRLDLAAQLKS